MFVSGCVHECPSCYKQTTWRVILRQPFTKRWKTRSFKIWNDTYRIKRRGFPSPAAMHCIRKTYGYFKLVQRIRTKCPGKDIWVWTGYKLDELNAAQMQNQLINVLSGSGKFIQF
ncbi:4Fe-4S cluster-binding domain-containing protein [Shigella flexneri]